MNTQFNAGQEILDQSLQLLQTGKTDQGLNRLNFSIWKLKNNMSDDQWQEFCKEKCHRHEVLKVLHRSDISKRAFEKPRGYAGDAVLMDNLYGYNHQKDSTVFNWEYNMSGGMSVRERRSFMARYIDDLAENSRSLNILSVACGHLREFLSIKPHNKMKIENFYALDGDLESLKNIDMECEGSESIKLIHANVIDLLRKKIAFGELDLIYSLGLLDYLNDFLARKLIQFCFTLLKSKGKMVIANFAPNLVDQAYLEAFMDWHLIYRDEQDMEQLLSKLPPENFKVRSFRDNYKNIVYLEITKVK
ncbi:MAG: hypothetical protein D8M58_18490 [Calditrichaeota bacterium]|nr:MAG: hypothetical protein DWQ03_11720 [Calditrichota bacterium]MBL1207399.1 hypothetical protein [Calditrichota bacterium]NOG47231.1 hypothetical protein [Calditrichota bacterium]